MADYPIKGYPANLHAISLTILSGASASEMFSVQGEAIVGIVMPAAWTAAAIGLKACLTGNAGDLNPVYNQGGVLVQTLADASQQIAIPFGDTPFFPFLQLTSVTAASTTGVNQGADRTIIVLLRKYLN